MPINLRLLGKHQPYENTWRAMKDFTHHRCDQTVDEIWALQHSPVFTQGLAGKSEHIIDAGNIPVIKSDRGGQVTYHGPGQLVCYLLLDLKRHKLAAKSLVSLQEQAIIDLLTMYQLSPKRKPGAPGVYVDNAKIAALGLRVRQGYSYHGLSLNIKMDLFPFDQINPCGYADLPITQLCDLGVDHDISKVENDLLSILCDHLNYNQNQRHYFSSI